MELHEGLGPVLFFVSLPLLKLGSSRKQPKGLKRVGSAASLSVSGLKRVGSAASLSLKKVSSELSLQQPLPQKLQPKVWDRFLSQLPSKSSKELAWLARIFCIWPIKAALPLSIVRFALARASGPRSSLRSKTLDVMLGAEFLFWVHFRVKLHLLSKKPPAARTYKYPGRDRQEYESNSQEFNLLLDHFKGALPTHGDDGHVLTEGELQVSACENPGGGQLLHARAAPVCEGRSAAAALSSRGRKRE
jgi:hypothetical protein